MKQETLKPGERARLFDERLELHGKLSIRHDSGVLGYSVLIGVAIRRLALEAVRGLFDLASEPHQLLRKMRGKKVKLGPKA
jgi:hypothetical protein